MRYVITPDIALLLVERDALLRSDVKLVAPTLLRSQVLTLVHRRSMSGELSKEQAEGHLDAIRGLKIRLLGDRVLQANAWRIATELGWDDTYDAEYIALTRLQADAMVTGDAGLAEAARGLVTVAEFRDLATTAT